MRDESEMEIAQIAATLRSGSIIAAAGCGKTEQIVRASQIAEGRRLILTHTHAGVDAIRQRLDRYGIPKSKYRVDTIASWCLRYAASFPKGSGLACDSPKESDEWDAIYEATARLIRSGAVKGVLISSYSGVLVDEYQDCTRLQHEVITSLAVYLPVCIFGDPLQAIFDFKGQKPVEWSKDVFPVFNKAAEMTIPWRWRNAGNKELADWLAAVRGALERADDIDLTQRPTCVHWESLPDTPQSRQSTIISTCKSVLGKANGGKLVVIGDSANINARTKIARNLASVGFTNVEPLACKNLYDFAKKLDSAKGLERLKCILDVISACMTGVEKKAFLDAVESHLHGGKRGKAKFGNLLRIGITIVQEPSDEVLLELMLGFHDRSTTHLFRRQMFFAMRAALQIRVTRQYDTLTDAVWMVQNRIRHAGRTIGQRCIGSTLLVKGLEFEHAVIIHADSMTSKDWYVALTRATSTITILSPSECISPAVV